MNSACVPHSVWSTSTCAIDIGVAHYITHPAPCTPRLLLLITPSRYTSTPPLPCVPGVRLDYRRPIRLMDLSSRSCCAYASAYLGVIMPSMPLCLRCDSAGLSPHMHALCFWKGRSIWFSNSVLTRYCGSNVCVYIMCLMVYLLLPFLQFCLANFPLVLCTLA